VFAVISGLGGKKLGLRCTNSASKCACRVFFFPNVELPVVAEQDFYTLYFSKGVLLEAELLARRLSDDESSSGPAAASCRSIAPMMWARPAAKSLSAALTGSRRKVVDRPMGSGGRATAAGGSAARCGTRRFIGVVAAARPISPHSRVLRPHAADVLMSGLMGGLGRHAVAARRGREATHMSYPFDLPEENAGCAWTIRSAGFAIRHIPVVAEQVQTDTYLRGAGSCPIP